MRSAVPSDSTRPFSPHVGTMHDITKTTKHKKIPILESQNLIKADIPNPSRPHRSPSPRPVSFSVDMEMTPEDSRTITKSFDGSDVAAIPIHEMIDTHNYVRQQKYSSFLNRFFPPDAGTATGRACSSSNLQQDQNKDYPKIITQKTKKVLRRTEIKFQTYGSDFKIEIQKDRLRVINTRPIQLFDRGRHLGLGVNVQTPPEFFVLTNCFNPPGCICVTETFAPGSTDVRAQILNTTGIPVEIPALALQIHIHVLPRLLPEPWQTINLPPPSTDDGHFDLRTRRSIDMAPRCIKIVLFDATHLCQEKQQSALIVPCRYLTHRKVIVEPTVWKPRSMPIVKVMNTSNAHVYLPAGTTLAKVMFTYPGISQTSPSLTSTIMSLQIPKTPVVLSRPSQTRRSVALNFK